jgi:hypothetical protein
VENIDLLTRLYGRYQAQLEQARPKLEQWLGHLSEDALRRRLEHSQNLLSLELMKVSEQLGEIEEEPY